MSFFSKLIADAQPKANTLVSATKNITNKVVDSKAVQATKNIGYKSLVNTVGVGLALAQPVATKMWSVVEKTAQPAAKK